MKTDPTKRLLSGYGQAFSLLLRCLAVLIGIGILLQTQIAFAAPPEGGFTTMIRYVDGQPFTVLEIGEKCDVGTVVRAFNHIYQEKNGQPLTWEILYAYDGNKDAMIPICDAPKDGRRFVWRGALGESVWREGNCPQDKKRAVFVAFMTIKVPTVAVETYDQMQARLKTQDACFKDVPCLEKRITKLGGKPEVNAGQAQPAPQAPPASVPPVSPSMQPMTPSSSLPVSQGIAPQVVQPSPSDTLAWLAWALVFILIFGSVFGFVKGSRLLTENRTLKGLMKKMRETADSAREEAVKRIRDSFEASLAAEQSKTAATNEHIQKITNTIAENAKQKMQLETDLATANRAKERSEAGFASAKRDLDAFHAKTARLAELYQAITIYEPDVIRIDNQLSDLRCAEGELAERYRQENEAHDPAADQTLCGLEDLKIQIGDLLKEREGVLAKVEPIKPELYALHRELAGFDLQLDVLYQRAQRDRNDAARLLGEASAKMSAADSKLAYSKKATVKLEEGRAALKEGFERLDKKESELVDERLRLDDESRRVQALYKDMLRAANRSPETPLEEIEELGGIPGLVSECADNFRKMEAENVSLKADVTRLNVRVKDLTEPDIEIVSRLSSPPPLSPSFLELVSDADAQSAPAQDKGDQDVDKGKDGASSKPNPEVALRAALRGLDGIKVYTIDTLEELRALDRLRKIRYVADPARLFSVEGQTPPTLKRMLENVPVLNKLEQLQLDDLGWWLSTFDCFIPAGHTLVPVGGAPPPAEGNQRSGSG